MPTPNDKPPIIINIDKAMGIHIGDTYISESSGEAAKEPTDTTPKPKSKYIINQINPPKPE